MGPFNGCSPSGTGCSSVSPPWGHRSCQTTFSSVCSSPQATGPGRNLLQHGVSMGSLPNLFHYGPSWAAGAQPASLRSAPWAAGESLLWRLEQLLHSICTDFGVCRVVSLT